MLLLVEWKDLYILNLNEASMALDDDVNVEMHRLRFFVLF